MKNEKNISKTCEDFSFGDLTIDSDQIPMVVVEIQPTNGNHGNIVCKRDGEDFDCNCLPEELEIIQKLGPIVQEVISDTQKAGESMGDQIYQEMNRVFQEIIGTTIQIVDPDGNLSTTGCFEKVEYNHETQEVKVKINEMLKPFLRTKE